MNLIVAETFYSLQCEGRSIGTPAVFLRLGGCNLDCIWCDTVEVWKHGKMTKFENVLSGEFVKRLKEGAHLVVTGGEPLLHQNKIVEYFRWFHSTYSFDPFIEVETNATIKPEFHMNGWVNWWNVSPKLRNSGEPVQKRIYPEVLDFLNNDRGTIFKFVINKPDDVLEVFQDFNHIDMDKIWLMPAADNQETLNEKRVMVAELARDLGLRYSDRLHIAIWNKKTGV